MPLGESRERVEWAAARLARDQAAELIALGEGLVAIGRLRSGEPAGQISIHNFLVRAAVEGDGERRAALVVLMRAGILRRHTFFCRYREDDEGRARLELPGPLDRGWEWRGPFEEARDRLVNEPVWAEAVGGPFQRRAGEIMAALERGTLVRLGDAGASPPA